MHKHKFTIVLLSPLPVKIRILLITRLVARRKVHIWLHVSKQVATRLPCQSRLIIGHPGHPGRHLGHRGHHTLGHLGKRARPRASAHKTRPHTCIIISSPQAPVACVPPCLSGGKRGQARIEVAELAGGYYPPRPGLGPDCTLDFDWG